MNATVTALHAKAEALIARTSTPALCTSLRTLNAQAPGPERNLMMHWTQTALTTRYPAAEVALNAAYDTFEQAVIEDGDTDAVDFDPVDVVLGAIPVEDQL